MLISFAIMTKVRCKDKQFCVLKMLRGLDDGFKVVFEQFYGLIENYQPSFTIRALSSLFRSKFL